VALPPVQAAVPAVPPYPPVPATIDGAQTHVYKTHGRTELPLFVFTPPGEAATPRSAVVFFHGSGWTAGTVLQFTGYARRLAEHGVVAALAEYRIKERYGATPFDAVADAKSAVRWLRRNAGQLGVDPKRIVAAGGSAGAHIAFAAALYEGRFDDPGDDLSVPARPDALVLFVPVLDTTESGYRELIPLFGGRERELSLIHHLRAGLPPTIILHGGADPWIPAALVERFTAQMRATGNDCERIAFAGRSHVFYNAPEYARLRPHIRSMEAKYSPADFVLSFYLLEGFLYRHGFTSVPPAVLEIPD
jgi:acetyl esterase/lipase